MVFGINLENYDEMTVGRMEEAAARRDDERRTQDTVDLLSDMLSEACATLQAHGTNSIPAHIKAWWVEYKKDILKKDKASALREAAKSAIAKIEADLASELGKIGK